MRLRLSTQGREEAGVGGRAVKSARPMAWPGGRAASVLSAQTWLASVTQGEGPGTRNWCLTGGMNC